MLLFRKDMITPLSLHGLLRSVVRRLERSGVGWLFLAVLGASPLAAQPTGGQVVAGAATISTSPGALTVTQSSDRAIIHWQDFSIASGGLARFVQPDATSATLNRVISGLPSSLAGSLEANGRVFLINPNGVIVGAQARIDTGGFLASTLEVANDAFLAGGDLHFRGDSTAAIQNLGAINALGGDVFLIARQVENSGTITAANGAAGLAAGSEVLLTTGGDERIFVQAAAAPGTVVNAGLLAAATAELKAAGGNAYALAINNSGTVRATGSAVRNGQLWLVAAGDGTVENSGTLEARGATGGGRILVLGGTQAGGRVTVSGTLDASSAGGDGGFIETSAASVQVTDGARVTTAAPNGRNGTWLIDPVDFTIAASGGDMTGAAVGTALAGGNFTIQSTTGGTGTAGDVNVNDAVSWSANRLTLNAQNNINFNALLNGSGTASLTLEYGQGAVAAGNPATYRIKAAINLPAGNNFSTKLGSNGAPRNFTVITSLGAAGSTTATDLQGMAGNLAGLYALGADIDATATSGWNAGAGFAPIGTSAARYTGTFDGLGHAVSGLTIARPTQNDVGLVGYLGVGGELRNIGLAGGSVTGMTGVGALLGNNSGSVSYASAATTVSGRNNVGGLVGASLGPIANVWATGNVSNVAGGTGFVGGLVGNSATGGSITNGWASGNVTALGPNAGGLVGFNSTSVISNTYATGAVSGTTIVGGLVGSVFGNINNSYATGAVSGSTSRVGGLAGHIYAGMTVSNSYATGSVSGPSLVGGFAGSSDGTVTNGYWDSTVTATGMGSGSGATGRTTMEMKALASFTGFDLSGTGGSSSVWRIYEGNTTPWLRVFLTPLTVTPNNDTRTYSGAAYSGGNGVTYSVASPSPALAGALAYGGGAQSARDAGTYAIIASGLFSVQQGYDLSYAAGTLTINPANLVLTGTRVYDGSTAFAGANLTATGVNGESFTVTGAGGSGNLSTKNVQTSQALASVTGLTLGTGNSGAALASNYNALASAGSAVSVTAKVLTIVGFASDNKVYDGTPAAVIATPGTLSGVISGDTVGFSQTGATFDTKDIGTDKTTTLNGVTLTGSGDEANYLYTATTTDQSDIAVATLTYTADPANRTYGSANPALSGTITGFVPGETQTNATTGTLAFTTTATVTTNVGTYAINGSGLTANDGNYVFMQAPANATALTINRASLILTGTRVYNGATAFAGENLTATGVNGETFAVTGTGDLSNLSTRNVQTNQALATVTALALGGSSNGGLTGNYTALSVTGSAVSVTPASLTVSATDAVKIYDGGTTATSYATLLAGSLSEGDFLDGGTFAFTNKDVGLGDKTVTVADVAVNDGNSGHNYTLTLVDNTTSTIDPADLVLTGTQVYNGTTDFAGPRLTATGVNGETFAVTGNGVLGRRDVQDNEALADLSGLALGTGNSAAAVAGNYNPIAGAESAVSVTPADLTASTGNVIKIYDGNTTAVGTPVVTLGTLFTGDTLAGGTFAFVGKNVGPGNKTVTVAGITVDDGNNGDNYTLTFVDNTTSTINPATLTYVANTGTRPVNTANPAFSGSVTGFAFGETVATATTGTLAFGTPATVASPVGTYAINGSGLTANFGNYTFVQAPPNATAFTITASTTPPANVPLTITADNQTKLYGAALPAFTATFAGFVNGDTSASVTGLQFSTTATMGSNVGTYTITPFGAVAPSTYVVGYVPGLLTISRAPLTITANNLSQLFGAPAPAFTASFSGLVNGDTSAVVSGLSFTTPPILAAGNFPIVPQGATAANYSLFFVNGTLQVTLPTVSVGSDEVPVVVIGNEPALTPEFALVERDGRLVLVAVGDPGDESLPPDERLTLTLGEATELPTFENRAGVGDSFIAGRVTGMNLGGFELVASIPGGNSGRADSALVPEPGLFRETSMSMGGFNVIYHEALVDVQAQRAGQASLGSSYREFSDSDNPQVNLVRTKVERKPGESTAAPTGPGSL